MTLQEQLRAFQTKRNEISERQAALMTKAGDEGRTLDETEASEYDSLKTELKHTDAHIERLREHVESDDATKHTVKSNKGPTIIVKTTDPDDKFPGQSYTRIVIAKALAKMSGFEYRPSEIAEHRWGKSHPNLVQILKSGVAGGGTGSGEWGASLAQADLRYTGDFVDFLKSKTVFDALPLREVPDNVAIKGQDGIATGYWLGESKPVKVSAQSTTTVTLSRSKVGALSVCSRELLMHSSPAAEQLIRDGLVESLAQIVDQTFLGTAGASAPTPAGVLNGVSSLGSNGYDAEALRADVKELYAPFLSAKNASGLYFVMTPSQAKAISLMVNALGQTEFPGLMASGGTLLGDPVVTGDNVGATTIILLKPSEIWKIGDGGVSVELSTEATIEQDTAPAGASDTPVAQSATPVSMFQTESVAFKCTRVINYQKRRTHAAQFISDAQYGNESSTTA